MKGRLVSRQPFQGQKTILILEFRIWMAPHHQFPEWKWSLYTLCNRNNWCNFLMGLINQLGEISTSPWTSRASKLLTTMFISCSIHSTKVHEEYDWSSSKKTLSTTIIPISVCGTNSRNTHCLPSFKISEGWNVYWMILDSWTYAHLSCI